MIRGGTPLEALVVAHLILEEEAIAAVGAVAVVTVRATAKGLSNIYFRFQVNPYYVRFIVDLFVSNQICILHSANLQRVSLHSVHQLNLHQDLLLVRDRDQGPVLYQGMKSSDYV